MDAPAQTAELSHNANMVDLEVERQSQLAAIDADKFEKTVQALGPQTIATIAEAGPMMQARLMESLNVKAMVVTDGKNPINLFNTASGLVSQN